MQFKGLPRTMVRGSRLRPPDLSPDATRRLQALEMWRRTGQLQDVCEVFRLSRATLYRWRRCFDRSDLTTLEARSRRPRRLRRPLWTPALMRRVEQLRRQYPRWGKAKLVILLGREGLTTSASTIGRILAQLRRRGRLVDPPMRRRPRPRRHPQRPWAQRCPGGPPPPMRPGDLVQLDTMHLRPSPGVHFRQFTARDVVSRWDVLEVHLRGTSQAAELFLAAVLRRSPFPIRAFQIDGGSEFKAGFEAACQRLGVTLYLLPPHSPKLNAYVERANGTHRREFYEIFDALPHNVTLINRCLLDWEHTYNHVRPHASLRGLTPAEFLATFPTLKPPSSHMY